MLKRVDLTADENLRQCGSLGLGANGPLILRPRAVEPVSNELLCLLKLSLKTRNPRLKATNRFLPRASRQQFEPVAVRER